MKQKATNKAEVQSPVKVLIRVRPLISIEKGTQKIVNVQADERTVRIHPDNFSDVQIKFDRAIDDFRTQKQMFQVLRSDFNQILQGYNMTIFAYGQTGSGKTYTMFGRDWENNFQQYAKHKKQSTSLSKMEKDQNIAGLIPRCAHELFKLLQNRPDEFNIFCSFLQIYNQKVYDLLNDTLRPQPLHIHESKMDGIFVEGLGQFQVNHYADILQLVKRGQKNRNIRQTSMNAKSSRSHTVFQIVIESVKAMADGSYIKVKLNLCDLAGSQKINKKQSLVSEHLEELKNINLSLTTLGKVIKSLSSGDSKLKSAFRQSKLTRLLQDSLVGNTKTFIIGNISPSTKNIEQTMNTLKFVERARHIKLKIKPTAINSNNQELIKKLQNQLEHMRQILRQKTKQKQQQQINEEVKRLMMENNNLKTNVQHKDNQFDNLMTENRQMKMLLHRFELIAMADFSQNETDSERQYLSDTSSSTSRKRKKQRSDENMSEAKQNFINEKAYSRLNSRANSRYNDEIEGRPIQTPKKSTIRGSLIQNRNPIGSIIHEKLPFINDEKKRNQTLDPIQQEQPHTINRSFDAMPKKKEKYDRSFQKKSIIRKLEGLEQNKKNRQQVLLKDLSLIERQNKSDEFRYKKKVEEEGMSTTKKRGKSRIDYSQKIRELEMRLRRK